MTDSPASIRNGRLDILAVNRLGRALYAPLLRDDAREEFRTAWAKHNVRLRRSGRKHFRPPPSARSPSTSTPCSCPPSPASP